MQRIEEAFEGNSEHEVRLIRGSSGKHYAQIRNGAPFDIFLSADQLRPRRLVEEGIAKESDLTTYAQGQLALWSRQNDASARQRISFEYKQLRRNCNSESTFGALWSGSDRGI